MHEQDISLYDAEVTIKLRNVAGNGRAEDDLREEVKRLITTNLPPWARDEVTFDRITVKNVRHQPPGEKFHGAAVG